MSWLTKLLGRSDEPTAPLSETSGAPAESAEAQNYTMFKTDGMPLRSTMEPQPGSPAIEGDDSTSEAEGPLFLKMQGSDGDPDRPVVLGSLFNPADAPDAQATVRGWDPVRHQEAVGGNQTETIGAGRTANVNQSSGPDDFDLKIESIVPAGVHDDVVVDGRIITAQDSAAHVPWKLEPPILSGAAGSESANTGSDSLTHRAGDSMMKESGEKGGTEDINIGVGELQETTISKIDLPAITPKMAETEGPGGGDTLTHEVGHGVAEGGEKGGTEDINIGVGELQETTISKIDLPAFTPKMAETQRSESGDTLGHEVGHGVAEGGEKGGTEDINIGVGELQEISPAGRVEMPNLTFHIPEAEASGGGDTLTHEVGHWMMKESGEKGGTEDINIGVGELQEVKVEPVFVTSWSTSGDADGAGDGPGLAADPSDPSSFPGFGGGVRVAGGDVDAGGPQHGAVRIAKEWDSATPMDDDDEPTTLEELEAESAPDIARNFSSEVADGTGDSDLDDLDLDDNDEIEV